MNAGAAEPLRGSLQSWGGKYHYRCERGHNVQSSEPYVDVCPAPLRPVAGELCGADIIERIVPYRGEGEADD